MSVTTFKTNPFYLQQLLKDCHEGRLKLPDFQRSWVWDEDRIKALITSISRAFPIGALMTLGTGSEVEYQPRRVEGTPSAADAVKPMSLLLDGQQRMTSLYQVAYRGEVVKTMTVRNKPVSRWFYIDMRKALDESVPREEAILSVPANKRIETDFGRVKSFDVSTEELEFDQFMFPVAMTFRWGEWMQRLVSHHMPMPGMAETWDLINAFKRDVLDNFIQYQVPVIELGSDTSKEAVCTVFEKVNTGGKPLDAFELVTAMYAASGHELRRDWYGKGTELGRQHRLAMTLRPATEKSGILAGVSNTDFLQAISLFHTRDRRRVAEAQGKVGKDLPAIAAHRAALLALPLDAYKLYQDRVEQGFVRAAKFLHTLSVFRIFDLPYQSQLVPLAAIMAEIGDAWAHEANRAKIAQWYWSGVFGELYGSTVDTRIARDFVEVPEWLKGGDTPITVRDGVFRADRLDTMRMRISAAYKGVNALLMKEGARDFRSGQKFDQAVFFGEEVDIHHIFPKRWCEIHGIKQRVYDSIINKTPLSFSTNRAIGGVAPSAYLGKLQAGNADAPPITQGKLDGILATHLIDPSLLRADDFAGFMQARKSALLALIQDATGQPIEGMGLDNPDGDEAVDQETVEAGLTIASQPSAMVISV